MPSLTVKNRTYDRMKFVTTIVLPALGALYFGLAGIWGFPYGEQVVGTITLLVTFLGICLKISDTTYKKVPEVFDGTLVVNDTNPDRDIYRFELDSDIIELGQKDSLKLRVRNPLKDASQE